MRGARCVDFFFNKYFCLCLCLRHDERISVGCCANLRTPLDSGSARNIVPVGIIAYTHTHIHIHMLDDNLKSRFDTLPLAILAESIHSWTISFLCSFLVYWCTVAGDDVAAAAAAKKEKKKKKTENGKRAKVKAFFHYIIYHFDSTEFNSGTTKKTLNV